MQVVVMRHGERNDQHCYDRGFIGQGLELAPLTDNGVKQAEEAAKTPLIDGCSIIVSSPYTRCMQTAAIVSRIRNIPLQVEVDLHEWIPDLLFQNKKEKRNHMVMILHLTKGNILKERHADGKVLT